MNEALLSLYRAAEAVLAARRLGETLPSEHPSLLALEESANVVRITAQQQMVDNSVRQATQESVLAAVKPLAELSRASSASLSKCQKPSTFLPFASSSEYCCHQREAVS